MNTQKLKEFHLSIFKLVVAMGSFFVTALTNFNAIAYAILVAGTFVDSLGDISYHLEYRERYRMWLNLVLCIWCVLIFLLIMYIAIIKEPGQFGLLVAFGVSVVPAKALINACIATISYLTQGKE